MTRRTPRPSSCVICVAVVAGVRSQTPRVHELPLTPEHVHWGYYDARLTPALRVASGDRVRVETMVAGGLQRLRLAGVPEADIPRVAEGGRAARDRARARAPIR